MNLCVQYLNHCNDSVYIAASFFTPNSLALVTVIPPPPPHLHCLQNTCKNKTACSSPIITWPQVIPLSIEADTAYVQRIIDGQKDSMKKLQQIPGLVVTEACVNINTFVSLWERYIVRLSLCWATI